MKQRKKFILSQFYPKKSRFQFRKLSVNSLKTGLFSLVDIHPVEVARQLTLIAWNKVQAIPIFDMTNKVSTQKKEAKNDLF